MLFKTKAELSRYLGCSRPKVYTNIKKGIIKPLYDNKGNKAGYVIVLETINYLSK